MIRRAALDFNCGADNVCRRRLLEACDAICQTLSVTLSVTPCTELASCRLPPNNCGYRYVPSGQAHKYATNLVCSTRSLLRDQSNLDFVRLRSASFGCVLRCVDLIDRAALYNSIKLEVLRSRACEISRAKAIQHITVTCTDSRPRV